MTFGDDFIERLIEGSWFVAILTVILLFIGVVGIFPMFSAWDMFFYVLAGTMGLGILISAAAQLIQILAWAVVLSNFRNSLRRRTT